MVFSPLNIIIISFAINISGHGSNYSWSMFRLENSLLGNYFKLKSIVRYNKYQRNMYFIGLNYERDTQINTLSQFRLKITTYV